ncbi:MAG: hypothetical protein ACJ797_22785 [Ktedonobacteraceae bacterium]
MIKTIRLTILSALEVLTFAGALVYFLNRIASTLERIGGTPDSYLAKLSFGLRAIEKETSHLAPQVTQLNQGLEALAGELSTSDEHLKSVAEALVEEKEVSL